MNYYLLTQVENQSRYFGYYDSCLVVADSEQDARKIHPKTGVSWNDEKEIWLEYSEFSGRQEKAIQHGWANHINNITVELLEYPPEKSGLVLKSSCRRV